MAANEETDLKEEKRKEVLNSADIVTYVEPNWEYNYTKEETTDGQVHEKQMDLSDLCIAVELECEVTTRANGVQGNNGVDGPGNRIYTVAWDAKTGSKVGFTSGTRLYRTKEDEKEKNDNYSNFLTTNYADAYYYDKHDYGITEMFGIDNINIAYDNMMCPSIEVTFTDIRGIALFSKSEQRNDAANAVSVVSGSSEKNDVQSFFHCFFTFPYPKFRILVKGFYGQSVCYELTCADFKATFKPDSGDFEAKAKFVGYSFNFLNDVSMLALIAAPYSDGLGKEYWDSNLTNRFTVGEGTQKTPMLRLGEMVRNFNSLHQQAVDNAKESDPTVAAVAEAEAHPQQVSELKTAINTFYEGLEKDLGSLKWKKSNFTQSKMPGEPKEKKYFFVAPADDDNSYPVALAITQWDPNNSNEGPIKTYKEKYNLYAEALNSVLKEYNNNHPNNQVRNPFDTKNRYGALCLKKIYNDEITNKTKGTYLCEHTFEYTDMVSTSSVETVKTSPFALSGLYTKYNQNEHTFDSFTHISTAEAIGAGGIKRAGFYTHKWKCKVYKKSVEKIDIRGAGPYTLRGYFKNKYSSMVNNMFSSKQVDFINGKLKEEGWYSDDSHCLLDKKDMYVWLINVGKMFDANYDENNGVQVTEEQKEQAAKVVDDELRNILGPHVSLVALTKTVMAHFETFMYMMYTIVEHINADPSQRTVDVLGLTKDNLNDWRLQDSKPIPPFPQLTITKTEEDEYGRERQEFVETWPGDEEFKRNGTGHWYEEDFINALLKGVEEFADIVSKATNQSGEKQQTRISVLTSPTSFGDLCYKTTPFVNEQYDITRKMGSLAKQVITRAFALACNANEPDYAIAGKLDGVNFNNAHNGTYHKELVAQIKGDTGSVMTSDLLINIATQSSSASGYENDYGDKKLIEKQSDGKYHWVPKYATTGSDKNAYPFVHYKILSEDVVPEDTLVQTDDMGNSTIGTNSSYYFDLITNMAIVTNIQAQTNESEQKDYFSKAYFTNESNRTQYDKIAFAGRSNTTNLTKTFTGETLTPVNRQIVGSEYLKQTTTCWEGSGIIGSITTGDGKQARTPFSKDGIIDENGTVDASTLTIPEFYGFNQDGTINTQKCLFTQANYYNIEATDKQLAQTAIWVLGLDFGNLTYLSELGGNPMYMPYFAVVQFGAYYWLTQNANPGTWARKIASNWRWSSVAESIKKKYIEFVPLRFMSEFKERFASTYGLQIQFKYSFPKEHIETIYQHIPTNLVGDDAVNALAPLSNILEGSYIAIGTEIDQNGFRLATKHSELIGQILSDLLKPTLFLPYTKYVLKGENLPPALSESNLKVYLDEFIKQFKIEIVNGTENNSNFESGSNIQLATADSEVPEDVKISLYNYLKLIYDKWIPSNSLDEWKVENFFNPTHSPNKEGHNFYFIDSFYQEVGYKLYYNFEMMVQQLINITEVNNYKLTLLEFIAGVYAENKCNFITIQNFQDISEKKNMELMFKPVPYSRMSRDRKHPDFLVVFPYQAATNLDIEGSEYKDDSFDLSDAQAHPENLPIALQQRSGDDGFNVPAFGVCYGKQYQHYFKSIDIEMNAPQVNEVALKAKFAIARAARPTGSENGEAITFSGQDLFSIYSTNAYDCTVKMMGCAWVQPMMYFVLTNVPMFRGSYLIKSVKHSISNGNMETTFTGTRMANVASRFNKNPIKVIRAIGGSADIEAMKNEKADISNNCPYKVYPLFGDATTAAGAGPNLSAMLNKPVNKHGITMTYHEMISRIAQTENGSSGAHPLTRYLQVTCIYNYFASGREEDFYKAFRYDSNGEWSANGSTAAGLKKTPTKEVKDAVTNIFTKSPTWILTQPNCGTALVTSPVSVTTGGANFQKGAQTKSKKITVTDLQKLWFSITASCYRRNSNTQNKVPVVLQHSPGKNSKGKPIGEDTIYCAYDKSEPLLWKTNGSPTTQADTDKKTQKAITEAFESCLTQTMHSNAQLSCDLKFELVGGKEDTIKVTQTDGKTEHLHQVFDVAINGYKDYVKVAKWCTSDAGAEKPTSVIIQVVESLGNNTPSYLICDTSGTPLKSQDGKGFSKYAYMAAIKRYGDDLGNNATAKKEFTSLSGLTKASYDKVIKEKEIKVEDCENLIQSVQSSYRDIGYADGNPNFQGNYIINGSKGSWDVIKGAYEATRWIYGQRRSYPGNSAKTSWKSTKQCTTGPLTAIVEGGLVKSKFSWGGHYPQIKNTLSSLGFRPVDNIEDKLVIDWLTPQHKSKLESHCKPGDIIIMQHGGNDSQHMAMFVGIGFPEQSPFKGVVQGRTMYHGNEYKTISWLSDFLQFYPSYSRNPNGSDKFTLFRYS